MSVSARQASNCCLKSLAISTGMLSHSPVKQACTSFACVISGTWSSSRMSPFATFSAAVPAAFEASEFADSPSRDFAESPAALFPLALALVLPSILSRMDCKSCSVTCTYCDLYFKSPSACSASSKNSFAEIFSSPMAISQSKSRRSPAVNAPKLMLPCKRILGLGLPIFNKFFGISVWMPNSSSFLRQSCKKSRSSAPRIKMGELARCSK